MILNWLCAVGEWLLTNDLAMVLMAALFFATALVCQVIIIKMQEDDLEECSERLQEIEKELKNCRELLVKIGGKEE